ncbi:hypothetical protein ACQP2F_14040 [Actinoplanes sp. CA-030573]|uniref:hypothetical protein n=1 Tax=Actinoplanes sp. CA-030573 TaxID=3239898 RepID=UPI003D8D69B1
MIIDAALHQSLRALKLSGMLETLDARLAQARAGQLGQIEFLQVLCNDEITRREAVAMTRRVRRARFEESNTLINTSHQVFMNGPSYRPNKRPNRPAAPPKEAAG